LNLPSSVWLKADQYRLKSGLIGRIFRSSPKYRLSDDNTCQSSGTVTIDCFDLLDVACADLNQKVDSFVQATMKYRTVTTAPVCITDLSHGPSSLFWSMWPKHKGGENASPDG
jgi:hypothetical protein